MEPTRLRVRGTPAIDGFGGNALGDGLSGGFEARVDLGGVVLKV